MATKIYFCEKPDYKRCNIAPRISEPSVGCRTRRRTSSALPSDERTSEGVVIECSKRVRDYPT